MSPPPPRSDVPLDEEATLSSSATTTPLTTAHWFGGIGCAAHQLPSTFSSTCYFDSDDAARSIFTSAFPSTVCAGSFADALAPGSPFVRCATLARVGFASPPCVDISIVNSKRQESSACAELTVDCVRALRLVRHEVLCLETTTTVTSARGGRLLQSVYEAADDVGYVPHLMCLDPLRLGGCQSRCRAYIVFVRRDVYTRRGPFAPPSSYAICGAPTPLSN